MAGGAASLAALGAIAELELPGPRVRGRGRAARTCPAATPTGPATSSRAERHDDRGQQHRRRGPARPRGRALPRARARARRTWSTSPRSPARSRSRSATSTPGCSATTTTGRARSREAGERAATTPGRGRCTDAYHRYLDSNIADMKNTSGNRQGSSDRSPRASSQEFAGDGPWAHLDIAGTAYLERGSGDYYPHAGRHRLRRAPDRGARAARCSAQ